MKQHASSISIVKTLNLIRATFSLAARELQAKKQSTSNADPLL